MKIAKYMLILADYTVEEIEVFALHELTELDQFDLTPEERDKLQSSSQVYSKGRMFKIITVDINFGEKGDAKA